MERIALLSGQREGSGLRRLPQRSFALSVLLQEARHTVNGIAQVVFMGQEHDAEMVGRGQLNPCPAPA